MENEIDSLIERLRSLKPAELTSRLAQLEAEKKAIGVLLRAARAAGAKGAAGK